MRSPLFWLLDWGVGCCKSGESYDVGAQLTCESFMWLTGIIGAWRGECGHVDGVVRLFPLLLSDMSDHFLNAVEEFSTPARWVSFCLSLHAMSRTEKIMPGLQSWWDGRCVAGHMNWKLPHSVGNCSIHILYSTGLLYFDVLTVVQDMEYMWIHAFCTCWEFRRSWTERLRMGWRKYWLLHIFVRQCCTAYHLHRTTAI